VAEFRFLNFVKWLITLQLSIGQKAFQILLGPNCAPAIIEFSPDTILTAQVKTHCHILMLVFEASMMPLKLFEVVQDIWWP